MHQLWINGESSFGGSIWIDSIWLFLQETYSDPSLENVWRAEWGGEILFAHGSKHSKDIMILFKPSLNADIMKITVDKSGCFLVFSCCC